MKVLDFLKKTSTRNVISVLILIAIIVAVVVIYKKRIERFASPSADSENVAVVTYYYLPKCPYCVAFSDEWAKFEATSDPSLIKAVSIDASEDSNKKLVASEGISGYPTIRIVKDGNSMDYKGDRKASALIDYVANL
jgi:thiol-disulfide isomerase/thioredoxin